MLTTFTTPPEPDVHTETSSVALTPVTYEGAGNVKMKYDRDNKTLRGHLLNHMNNILFDLFLNQKSAKEIWNTLETRYGGDDAGRNKYVVGKWLQFHMTDDKPIMDQVHEYQNLVADVLSEGHKAYRCFQRKDQQKPNHKPPSQPRPQINLTEQEEVIAAVVVEANLMENKIDWILDTDASKHFCSNKELFQDFQEARDGECVFMGNSTTAGVLGKGKIFLKLTSGKTLALIDILYVPSLRRNLISGSLLNKAGLKIVLEADKNSAAYRFMCLKDSSICESRDAEFFEQEFPLIGSHNSHKVSNPSSTPMIPSTTELRRSKRQKTENSFGPDFLTIFLAEDIDRIDDHLVSAFFVDEDPKTYIEAVTSIDSSFWKEAIKNELDSILENHTWDLVDLPRGSKPIKCKWVFKKKIRPDGSIDKFKARLVVVGYTQRKAFLNGDLNEEIYMEQPEGFAFPGQEDKVLINDTKRFLSSQFEMKDLGEADVILVLEGFCDANWVTDNDETCIARSTMESEFIALELAGQEAEWLRKLVGDMPMWGSSVPVSIHCDSQAAIGIAKNYAYNGKRRHIHIRHGAVKELLKNGIISLEYVRSERNLADPLTKGLTRRNILETSRAMGLNP
ncbi:UNVERIFIED_CONTAM: Retrovirus-related Pol polyprotein from transposon TNT 1-94 [Sesamum calycinum]|uniref:Retrovirus-related Pol polyprotein from transposon TNT 1-94 n=1 Tax=Sesamum calycinum TaxID=2727403 RepID=A0AAW2MQN0_9LAMI